jgi:hypothetical protein
MTTRLVNLTPAATDQGNTDRMVCVCASCLNYCAQPDGVLCVACAASRQARSATHRTRRRATQPGAGADLSAVLAQALARPTGDP